MRYDVTIHDITKKVLDILQPPLEEARIGCVIEPAQGAAEAYLKTNCKPELAVSAVVNRLLKSPKATKAALRWNGSMAAKFLGLAGVWDGLSKTKKNVILGYEVAR